MMAKDLFPYIFVNRDKDDCPRKKNGNHGHGCNFCVEQNVYDQCKPKKNNGYNLCL